MRAQDKGEEDVAYIWGHFDRKVNKCTVCILEQSDCECDTATIPVSRLDRVEHIRLIDANIFIARMTCRWINVERLRVSP